MNAVYQITEHSYKGRSVVLKRKLEPGEEVLVDYAACSWSESAPDELLAILMAFDSATKLEKDRIMSLTDAIFSINDHHLAMIKSWRDRIASFPLEVTKGRSADELINLFMRAHLNAHAEPTGVISFFPQGAMVNHSCQPNAIYSMPEPGSIRFTAFGHLLAGEEVTSSYLGALDLLLPTYLRRKQLLSSKGFICRCTRCDSTDHDSSRQVRCPNCGAHTMTGSGCSGESSMTQVFRCSQCSTNATTEQADEIVALETKWMNRWNTLDADTSALTASGILADIKKATAELSPSHFIVQLLRIIAIEMGAEGRLPSAAYKVEAQSFASWLTEGLQINQTSLMIGAISALFDRTSGLVQPGVKGKEVLELIKRFYNPAVWKYGADSAYCRALRKVRDQYDNDVTGCVSSTCPKRKDEKAMLVQMQCGRCRNVVYCSRECQVADWKRGHKSACAAHITEKGKMDAYRAEMAETA